MTAKKKLADATGNDSKTVAITFAALKRLGFKVGRIKKYLYVAYDQKGMIYNLSTDRGGIDFSCCIMVKRLSASDLGKLLAHLNAYNMKHITKAFVTPPNPTVVVLNGFLPSAQSEKIFLKFFNRYEKSCRFAPTDKLAAFLEKRIMKQKGLSQRIENAVPV